jgi:5'(3')-deoxyribonucleotidase
MKPVILFDADGFLLDFATPALRIASEIVSLDRHGVIDPTYFKVEDFIVWDFFEKIGREHERACYAEYEKPGFCAAFEPYPGAVEGVCEAKKMADVVVVTSPLHGPVWDHERRQSLLQHFGIPNKDVIFASRKTLVKGRMLVDDNPSHIEAWAREYSAHGVGIIWDQPYNRSHIFENDAWNMMRCDSWDSLLAAIERVVRTHK